MEVVYSRTVIAGSPETKGSDFVSGAMEIARYFLRASGESCIGNTSGIQQDHRAVQSRVRNAELAIEIYGSNINIFIVIQQLFGEQRLLTILQPAGASLPDSYFRHKLVQWPAAVLCCIPFTFI